MCLARTSDDNGATAAVLKSVRLHGPTLRLRPKNRRDIRRNINPVSCPENTTDSFPSRVAMRRTALCTGQCRDL